MIEPYFPDMMRIELIAGRSEIYPPLDPTWPPLKRLRWHAAVARVDTGLRVLVHPVSGGFSVQVGMSSCSSKHYADAWLYISGVIVGAEQSKKASEDSLRARNMEAIEKELGLCMGILRKNRHSTIEPYEWFGPDPEPNEAGPGCACPGCQSRLRMSDG